MGVYITSRPYRTNKSIVSLVSKFNSAYQPIVYEFTRFDVLGSISFSTGGLLSFNEFTSAGQSKFVAGESVYFFSNSSPLLYPGAVAVVQSITAISGGFAIVLNTPYAGVPADILANSVLATYSIEITVKGWNYTTNAYETVDTLSVTPATNGRARVELQSFISKYLSLTDNVGYSHNSNRLDKDNSTKFYLEYYESRDGVLSTLISDASFIVYATNSVKQLGQIYGQNLGDYVPYNNNVLAVLPKLISDFDRPTFFAGYPFDISFLYPQELALVDGTIEEERMDVNGNILGTKNQNLDRTQVGGENRLMPLFPLDVPGYMANVESFNIWLKLGSLAVEEFANDQYSEDISGDSFAESLPESPPGAVTPFPVTQKMTIDYVRPCNKNPIYVRWKGAVGGWSYWLFDNNSLEDVLSKELGVVASEPVDLELALSRNKTIQRSANTSLKVGCWIPRIKYTGLKKIVQSAEIQIYTPNNQAQWSTVSLKKFKMDTEFDNSVMEVNLELGLAELYTIEQ